MNRMGKKSKSKVRAKSTIIGDRNPKGKKLIIWLFIIGMGFIVTSIFLSFTYFYYNERLAEKNETYRLYGLDTLLYQVNEQSSINTSFMILLGTEMVPPHKNLDYFRRHFRTQNFETLSSLHRVLFGKDPSLNLVSEWRKIDESNKFQDEKKKMFDKAILYKNDKLDGGPTKFGSNLLSQIENLTKRVHQLMIISIIFQVIGLVLNQIAIIFQITSKEG